MAQTVRIRAQYEHGPKDVYSTEFDIHMSRTTADIRQKLISWFRSEFNYDGPENDVFIYHGDEILPKDKSLKDAGLDKEATL